MLIGAQAFNSETTAEHVGFSQQACRAEMRGSGSNVRRHRTACTSNEMGFADGLPQCDHRYVARQSHQHGCLRTSRHPPYRSREACEKHQLRFRKPMPLAAIAKMRDRRCCRNTSGTSAYPYPLNVGLRDLYPQLLAACERSYFVLGRFRVFGDEVTVYAKATRRNESGATADNWITSDGLVPAAPAEILRKNVHASNWLAQQVGDRRTRRRSSRPNWSWPDSRLARSRRLLSVRRLALCDRSESEA